MSINPTPSTWQDQVRLHGLEFCVNKELTGRAESGLPGQKPLDPKADHGDEIAIAESMLLLENKSPANIAREIIALRDPDEPKRAAKRTEKARSKAKESSPDARLVTLRLSPRECGVLGKAIGRMLLDGFALVHARRLLDKLIAGEARGRLLDKSSDE